MMKTSRQEIFDLVKAWLAVSVAFTIVQGLSLDGVIGRFALSLFLVGSAFVLHELAHKYVAQRYGCWAEFRSDDRMLMIAILVSLIGFVFAAPGAVMIYGRVSRRQNGIISLAGPLTNIIVALLSLSLIFVPGLGTFGRLSFMINSWIALFNLIPVQPFDGSKILSWSKPVYFVMVGLSIAFMILQ